MSDALSTWERVTRARPDEIARGLARLREPRRPSVRPAVAGGLLAVAVAVTIVAVAPGLRTSPSSAPVASAEPRVSEALGDVAAVAPIGGVLLDVHGSGRVEGSRADLVVAWDAGTLGVEVEPGRGTGLSVTTSEATVRVVGTGFTVRRDVRGTSVDVVHGRVDVRCADGTGDVLGAGASLVCPPATAAGWLGLARARLRDGDAPADVLGDVDRGLASSPDPAVADELGALRIDLLARAGRDADALAEARGWLDRADSSRRDEVLRLAAGLAYRSGGCEAAAPYADDLVRRGATSPVPCGSPR